MRIGACLLWLLLAVAACAQQVNTVFASLAIDEPAANVVGQGLAFHDRLTDTAIVMSVQSVPGTPVIVAGGELAVGTIFPFNSSLDILPSPTGWSGNVLIDGHVDPSGVTSFFNGEFTLTAMVASCAGSSASCGLGGTFSRTFQALTIDPTNPPWAMRLTGAAQITFTNGYTELVATGSDGFEIYDFPAGYSFSFYGHVQTRAFVSANGYVAFLTPPTSAPFPTQTDLRNGVPRILAFYCDLDPVASPPAARIFATHFIENGERKVRISYEGVSSVFGSGPHDADVVLAEGGAINVFVPSTSVAPTLNVAVGVTAGLGLDPGIPAGPGDTFFGRDLTADVANGPVALGHLQAGFELFDLAIFPTANPIDVIGFNAPDGITFVPDAAVFNGEGYIVQ